MSVAPSPKDVLVRVRGLHFRQGRRVIYKGIDLDVMRGKVTAIMGPSGTGKTTLLRLIGGQWRPAQGAIEFDGTTIHTLRRGALYDLRRRMGMLFQFGALFTDLSVFDNVAFPLREHTNLPEALVVSVEGLEAGSSILFKDITPLLASPDGFAAAVEAAASTGEGYSPVPRATTATTAKITRPPMSAPERMRTACRHCWMVP